MDNPRSIPGRKKTWSTARRDRANPRWIPARVTAQYRSEATRNLLL